MKVRDALGRSEERQAFPGFDVRATDFLPALGRPFLETARRTALRPVFLEGCFNFIASTQSAVGSSRGVSAQTKDGRGEAQSRIRRMRSGRLLQA